MRFLKSTFRKIFDPGNRRLLALLLAAGLVLLTFAHPGLPLPRQIYRYVFILDITQSMNAQDYHAEGMPTDRLGFARETLRRVVQDLPCGSEVGLGLFTTQSVNLLFEPIEVCGHLPILDDVLVHIDWRMAWAANSFVAQGLSAALRDLARRDAGLRLVFLTDGQETPPQQVLPSFTVRPGEIRGVLVGVGGTRPTLVPRYDRENRSLGYWENADIEQMPVSSVSYDNQVEAPRLPREGKYLSWLDEAHLHELAALTGLRYHRLERAEDLGEWLLSAEFAERRMTPVDLRPYLGLAALLLVVGVHVWPVRFRWRKKNHPRSF